MLDFLLLVTSKNIVVSLAIMGAILTTFARALSGFVVSMSVTGGLKAVT